MKYKYKWIIQKLSAIIFLFSLILTSISLSGVDLLKYESIYNFMEHKYNAFLVLLLIVSILIHSNIGIVSIIDDYIHDEKSKILIIMLKNFLLALLLIITILSISIIVF